MAPSRSNRLFQMLPFWSMALALAAVAALTACGLSYEPKEGLEGGTAEDIGRNMLAGAQPNRLHIAVAASEDGWQIRHGRYPDVYDNELYVAFDRNTVLSVTGGSEDVSLNIPVFRVRRYVEAGKRTKVYFRAIRAGEFSIEGQVHVVTQAEWDEMFK